MEVSAAVSAAPGLVVEDHFAIVPEWLLDADICDAAIRLYAVLLRYGQSSGARMPGRATLARRLHKKSTDSVDRAMHELEQIGAVQVEHRYAGGQRLTNLYHLKATRRSGLGRRGVAADLRPPRRCRRRAASVELEGGGRTDAARGSRTDAAGVAANLRPNPEHLTQRSTSSPAPDADADDAGADPGNRWREEEDRFLTSLGITDMAAFVDRGAGAARRRRRVDRAVVPATAGRRPAGRGAGPRLAGRDRGRRAEGGRGGPGHPLPDARRRSRPVVGPGRHRSDRPPGRAGSGRGAGSLAGQRKSARWSRRKPSSPKPTGCGSCCSAPRGSSSTAEGAPLTRATVTRRAHQLLLAAREQEAMSA